MKLRTFILAVTASAFILVRGSASESIQVQIVRNSQEVHKSPQSNFVQNLIALVESCSVNSSAYAVTNSTWTNLLHSPSFVRVTFTPARKLNVMITPGVGPRERTETELQQLIVPLPENQWPDHFYGRIGDHVYSFTKYNPIAFKHFVLEPALGLASIKPYSDVRKLPEK